MLPKRTTAASDFEQSSRCGPAVVSGQMRYLLVVDRDSNERFTMSMLLQRFGYTVASADSAAEALEFLCVAPAEAVFAEADEAGDDLAVRLREDPRFRDMPLIVVADSPDRALEKRARQGELGGLLRKPLDPREVYAVIQKVIEKGTRRNIRIPTALTASLHAPSGAVAGYVTVLSQFGMFFRTLDPLPAKARVAVDLSVWESTIRLEAEVLYAVTFEEGPFSEPGMGMKFIRIEPQDSALIKLFIYEQLGVEVIPPAGQGTAAGQA